MFLIILLLQIIFIIALYFKNNKIKIFICLLSYIKYFLLMNISIITNLNKLILKNQIFFQLHY